MVFKREWYFSSFRVITISRNWPWQYVNSMLLRQIEGMGLIGKGGMYGKAI
jgi:hypothetical protein